jgi:hypothetical protein
LAQKIVDPLFIAAGSWLLKTYESGSFRPFLSLSELELGSIPVFSFYKLI